MSNAYSRTNNVGTIVISMFEKKKCDYAHHLAGNFGSKYENVASKIVENLPNLSTMVDLGFRSFMDTLGGRGSTRGSRGVEEVEKMSPLRSNFVGKWMTHLEQFEGRIIFFCCTYFYAL